MRMGLFWGVLLILLGLGIVVNIVFGIHIPIFRTLIALFLIFVGVKILFGNTWGTGPGKVGKCDVLLHERTFVGLNHEKNDYNVVFGKGTFDLRNVTLAGPTTLKVDTVFGGTEIWLRQGIPVKIELDSAFAAAALPDQQTSGFGKFVYQSENFNADHNHLIIKANVAFGNVEIAYR